MPLSEHEQRLLEQMERALYAEDPKFASHLRGADPRTHHRRRVLKASIGFIAGIALLLTGAVIGSVYIAVSVLGFLVMLASAFFALSSLRQIPPAGEGPAPASGGAAPSARGGRKARQRGGRSGFMARLEDRWNRRREEDGR